MIAFTINGNNRGIIDDSGTSTGTVKS